MKSNIFIPKTIRVGFQNRNDTYTKSLAYVIYIDELGRVRKEASWDGWRDHKIEPIDFENIPTSGFVLNKKVGDYADGWNHRKSYIRVYDPRNFEFEIDVSNLLYILENTNSIKGKGLDGEFVYGWDGKDLILIPTESSDYKDLEEYNNIVHENNYINSKELVVGATYLFKNNEEYVYLGKFDYYSYGYEYVDNNQTFLVRSYSKIPCGIKNYNCVNNCNVGKYFWFLSVDGERVTNYSNISKKIIKCVNNECSENYSKFYDILARNIGFSPIDHSLTKYSEMSYDDFCSIVEKMWYSQKFLDSNLNLFEVKKDGDGFKFCDKPSTTNIYCKEAWINLSLNEIFAKKVPVYKELYLKNGLLYKKETQ